MLRVRHDRQESYTADDVICMMRKWGYSTAYDGYGLALYCNQSDFEDYYAAMSDPYDYGVTRAELRSYLPILNDGFSAADVIELGESAECTGSRFEAGRR